MYLDSHCHLDLPDFSSDRDEVISRSRAQGVSRWVIAGIRPESWVEQARFVRSVDGAYYSVGLHPCAIKTSDLEEWSRLEDEFTSALSGVSKVVALGETGLDKNVAIALDIQKEIFRRQLMIAKRNKLPVILHVVGTHGHALDELRSMGDFPSRGVVHSFYGSLEVAKSYLELGFLLGINARWINRANTKLGRALAELPMSALLLESDAPDQSPRRGERNEPTAIFEAAEWVGRQKGLTSEEVLMQATKNGESLFGISQICQEDQD